MAKKTVEKKAVQQAVKQPPVGEQAATSQDTSIVDINSEVTDEETEPDGTDEQPPVKETDEDPLSNETDNEDGPALITTGFLKCDGIKYQPGDKFPIDHPEAERLFHLGAIKEG